jgi:hypothetical protein
VGIDEDTKLFAYLLPAPLCSLLPKPQRFVHRTTFTSRQAVNLCKVKELLWSKSSSPRRPLTTIPPSSRFATLCLPLPGHACSPELSAVLWLQRRKAAFGKKDTLLKQTFYGFRVHVREGLLWPGVITPASSWWPRPTPTSFPLCVLPELLAEGTFGLLIGERNYHSSPKTAERGVGGHRCGAFLAPYSSEKRDPAPKKSAFFLRAGFATG